MCQNKITVLLGLWIIALAFLGFSESLMKILLILTGFFVVVVSIRKRSLIKTDQELVEQIDQAQKDDGV